MSKEGKKGASKPVYDEVLLNMGGNSGQRTGNIRSRAEIPAMGAEISGLHRQRGSSSNVQEKFNINLDCCKEMGRACHGQDFYQRKLDKTL